MPPQGSEATVKGYVNRSLKQAAKPGAKVHPFPAPGRAVPLSL